MTYIIEAQLKNGAYMEHIKAPVTTNLRYAIFRAKELLKLPDVAYSDVCTINNRVIKHFVSKSNLA